MAIGSHDIYLWFYLGEKVWEKVKLDFGHIINKIYQQKWSQEKDIVNG